MVESVIACDLYESEVCDEKKGIRHLLLEQKLAAHLEESEISKVGPNQSASFLQSF